MTHGTGSPFYTPEGPITAPPTNTAVTNIDVTNPRPNAALEPMLTEPVDGMVTFLHYQPVTARISWDYRTDWVRDRCRVQFCDPNDGEPYSPPVFLPVDEVVALGYRRPYVEPETVFGWNRSEDCPCPFDGSAFLIKYRDPVIDSYSVRHLVTDIAGRGPYEWVRLP